MPSDTQTVVTRFAPSPTGFLHIGGARTALFNWLYARGRAGRFLLRIEDTDRKRSTTEAIDAIIGGLTWLGLDWDGDIIFQFSRADRHAEMAHSLLEQGKAYHCYAGPEELTEMREQARAEGRPVRYDGRWRDRDPSEAPQGIAPVVRLKAPQQGETVITDEIQGTVSVANSQLDDMILLRSDGTPTYMLSVVVDDHDMGITHIIRGDDHFTNAFRQTQLYQAFGWDTPVFAHVPLIHGPDGAKLSKRHGALGVEAYRDMGYLPEALRNYLLRLGWGHGDAEIISTEEATRWFGLDAVGKSPARFDFAKLASLNGHYIRNSDNTALVKSLLPFIEDRLGRRLQGDELDLLAKALPGLKERAKTLVELAESALFYFLPRPLALNEKAAGLLAGSGSLLGALKTRLDEVEDWTEGPLDQAVRAFAEENEMKLGKIAQPLRAALTGSNVSPGIFDVLICLGRKESLGRIQDQITKQKSGAV